MTSSTNTNDNINNNSTCHTSNNDDNHNNDKVALIFGISGEQGQYVAKGLLSTGAYRHVYGITRDVSPSHVASIEEHMGVPVRVSAASSARIDTPPAKDGSSNDGAGHVTLLPGDLNDAHSIRAVLASTRATDIFLVTTTDLPPEDGDALGSFHESEMREYESICQFFDVLLEVHREDDAPLERHVVFSTNDNVRSLVEWLDRHRDRYVDDGRLRSSAAAFLDNMKPLDDGSIVPHYSGKGRGAEYAMRLLHGVPSPWEEFACASESASADGASDPEERLLLPWKSAAFYSKEAKPPLVPGLTLTLLILPFLHSNFSKSTIPLPVVAAASSSDPKAPTAAEMETETETATTADAKHASTSSDAPNERIVQWSISACLGPSTRPLPMFSLSDLRYVVPVLFNSPSLPHSHSPQHPHPRHNPRRNPYAGRTLRVAGERLSMERVAWHFSDLFGKDVIYSPLTVEEMVGEWGDDGGNSNANGCGSGNGNCDIRNANAVDGGVEYGVVVGVRALAQMCCFLGSEFYGDGGSEGGDGENEDEYGDVRETEEIMRLYSDMFGDSGAAAAAATAAGKRRSPQTFQDWLLTHSDDRAFEKVGLSLDAKPITTVAVFNANTMQGESVIKGLLADTRKQYTIIACLSSNGDNDDNDQNNNESRDEKDAQLQEEARRIQSLNPERITTKLISTQTDDDATSSITAAIHGAEGAFLLTDFYRPLLSSPSTNTPTAESSSLAPASTSASEEEERRARKIIDACAASATLRHLVMSTLESADEVDNELKHVGEGDDVDVKARMAAYARSMGISVTFVLMPVYSERFFLAMAENIRLNKRGDVSEALVEEEGDAGLRDSAVRSSSSIDGGGAGGADEEQMEEEQKAMEQPSQEERVVCVSLDELGPAVANILDSYEVYAGHEIALITDVLSLSEATDIIENVFFERKQEILLENTTSSSGTAEVKSSSSTSLTMLAQSKQCKVVDTFAKDLGSIFREYSKTELVKQRGLVAKTMELVPDAKPFRRWLEENRDNVEFREMLGLR